MNPAIPMPDRIARLPRDKRGYPVPYVVARDPQGAPLFIVNDSKVQGRCIHKKLCPICGERLTKELWFAGGPRSAFDPHGHYMDSAMHHECCTYAMQVCPYMAMPKYHATEPEAKIAHLELRAGTLLFDHTQDSTRPAVMVVVMTYGQSLSAPEGTLTNPYIAPLRPYHAVEFWRHGARVPDAEGLAILREIPELDLSALRLIDGR